MPKKLAIAVVALVTGALMLPSHEALAHGGGGLGGGQGEGFYGGGSHGRTLEDDFHGSGFGVLGRVHDRCGADCRQSSSTRRALAVQKGR